MGVEITLLIARSVNSSPNDMANVSNVQSMVESMNSEHLGNYLHNSMSEQGIRDILFEAGYY